MMSTLQQQMTQQNGYPPHVMQMYQQNQGDFMNPASQVMVNKQYPNASFPAFVSDSTMLANAGQN